MAIPSDWIASAVAITPGFEVQGDPYEGVSGDFDLMGISCGALQWNIGSNSLQPMVRALGEAKVRAQMPIYGGDLWAACNTTIKKGLTIVRGWQNGSTLKAKAKAELEALMGSAAMRVQQDLKIGQVAKIAHKAASDWATSAGRPAPSKRGFCWFFDLTTQNGSLEGLKYADIADFISANTPEKADDVVCDFLAATSGTSGHVKDANANGKLWRNQAKDEKLEFLVLSYLRSKTSNPKWRHVVVNRKGTIAMGKGKVNSSLYDFAAHGL